MQEQFHKHAGTIPHCKNKRECLRKISVPYLFRYATGQQQVFTLMVHRCAAQRMTKNVYAIQKRMRPKSSALTSRARHSPHRAHYTGPPMDSFRSPMVSKYKVQKAGEKKKKDSASRWEQASKVHLPATYSNSRRTNFNASNIIRLNATAGHRPCCTWRERKVKECHNTKRLHSYHCVRSAQSRVPTEKFSTSGVNFCSLHKRPAVPSVNALGRHPVHHMLLTTMHNCIAVSPKPYYHHPVCVWHAHISAQGVKSTFSHKPPLTITYTHTNSGWTAGLACGWAVGEKQHCAFSEKSPRVRKSKKCLRTLRTHSLSPLPLESIGRQELDKKRVAEPSFPSTFWAGGPFRQSFE